MGGTPKTALPPQDHLGALTVVELNSPRVAPLHRFASILVHCSGDPLFPVPDNCREVYRLTTNMNEI
ncbi:hypothetical protein BJP36_37675 [Moorena producens JHB]|uniref:Uncharacterized protein n=1 Tax=Moorena producens (strain JHB) TaxID=1454205 RepID=A0A9Q9UWG5_MOOP1|nr:hypothetical protein [Moorena producens]WAN69826.1 hypothetical protein BJP36_37675 [Moorena producens JHB]